MKDISSIVTHFSSSKIDDVTNFSKTKSLMQNSRIFRPLFEKFAVTLVASQKNALIKHFLNKKKNLPDEKILK